MLAVYNTTYFEVASFEKKRRPSFMCWKWGNQSCHRSIGIICVSFLWMCFGLSPSHCYATMWLFHWLSCFAFKVLWFWIRPTSNAVCFTFLPYSWSPEIFLYVLVSAFESAVLWTCVTWVFLLFTPPIFRSVFLSFFLPSSFFPPVLPSFSLSSRCLD